MSTPVAPSALPSIRVAKIARCMSLSGLTELEYHVGYEAGTQDKIHIRITASNGNGKFNACWWSLADIEHALSSIPANAAFTVSALKSVFAGRSVNTMYFVLAAILNTGLLRRADPAEDGYVRNTPQEWWRELSALISAGTDLVPDTMAQGCGNTVSAPPKPAKKPARQAVNV